MSPPDPRLATALPALAALAVAPVGLVLVAALMALGRPLPWLGSLVLVGAAGCAIAVVVLTHTAPPGSTAFDVPLFTWSPLGLYGVTIGMRPSPVAGVLMLPPVALGIAAWLAQARADRAHRAHRRPSQAEVAGSALVVEPSPFAAQRRRHAGGDALSLVALAGTLWIGLAADLVSLYLGVTLFLLSTVGVLWAVAGAAPAGRRLVLAAVTGTTLLACVLILGKVNGHFQLSQLSTAGFTSAAFFGCAFSAAVAAPAPPFHRWLLRISRYPFAPMLAAAGITVALGLLLMAFRTTAGQLAPSWHRSLIAFGWFATLAVAGSVTMRHSPTARLAALFAGKASLVFFATAIATPASLAAALLYAMLSVPAFGLLWLLLRSPESRVPRPTSVVSTQDVGLGTRGGAEANGALVLPRSGAPAPPVSPRLRLQSVPGARPRLGLRLGLRQAPGFWLHALLLASAAGLPGTVGGVANTALVTALTSWPSGDLTLRVPPALLDATTLAIGGGLLWSHQRLHTLGGRWGQLLLVLATVVVVGPAVAPNQVIGSWFGLVAATATGTGTAPLRLDLARVPPVLSIALGVLAIWALLQRLRGREWLPFLARGILGAAALVWLGAYRAWRRQGITAGFTADALLLWLHNAADRLMALLRPLEERYYAAAAVIVAIALIYIIGR